MAQSGKKKSAGAAKKSRSRASNAEAELDAVLEQTQEETRRQLKQALEKKRHTGQSLMDILRQDVDRKMFTNIWQVLHRSFESGEEGEKGGRRTDADAPEIEEKQVKDVLMESGLVTKEEWDRAVDQEDAYDPQVGKILVEQGLVDEEDLREALAQHDRRGQSVWRILVNRGLVAPKQIADAQKAAAEHEGEAAEPKDLKAILLNSGLVTEEQYEQAQKTRQESRKHILQVLLDKGYAAKDELGKTLSKELGVPFVDLKRTQVEPKAADLLPQYLAEQSRMIPCELSDDRVRVAMANPKDVAAIEMFYMLSKKHVEPALAFESDIMDAIRRHHEGGGAAREGEMSPLERIRTRLRGSTAAEESMASMAENVGVVSLVASILEGAVNSRATDIHIEPQSYGLSVRYRIDGILYSIMNVPTSVQSEVISRVKVLGGMDITQRQHSQDGHFTITVEDREYDIRVATLPTVSGEKLVLRLLNPEDVFRGLRELGLESDQLTALEESIAEPHGMILATGPIGSGKTTTLYAILSEIDIFERNVVTIEDPVEYQLPGINQVQIDLRVHRTFADMVRSVVRQDADVIMIGEIRDEDTARVGVRAAMTGHQVLSTLHTNDAVSAVDTLRHLGIPPFLITNSLRTVVAQRLVRKLCSNCRERYKPEAAKLKAVGLTASQARNKTFYQAVGCDECFRTGYRGRTGIFEIFRIDDSTRELILKDASHSELLAHAKRKRMTPLMKSGLKKVQAGATTLDEILRVTMA